MKTKLLLLITLITALGHAQIFDWDNANIQGNRVNPNSLAVENINNISAGFRVENNTPILLLTGASGNKVINQQPEPAAYLSFDPGINIQSIEVFEVNTSGGWKITPIRAGSGSVVNIPQNQNAQTITLNWTNVSEIKIEPVNAGDLDEYGIDKIMFTPCVVNIPDANFKQYLLAIPGLDANRDNEIQCSEAAGYTGILQVESFGSPITDITGIEAFTSVINMTFYNNNLTAIDLSSNPLLQAVDIQQNNTLTSIDLSANPALRFVAILDNTNLTQINIASGTNTNINSFGATGNTNLTCIQIDTGFTPDPRLWEKNRQASYSTNCSSVCNVNIPDANFKAALLADTTINIDGDTEISCAEATAFTGTVNVSNKNIADLTGIEAFTNITGLWCFNNQLTSLDISNNTALGVFFCGSNLLTSLDVSANTNLFYLSCQNNNLSSLNIANGNNTSFMDIVGTPREGFNAKNNPNLTCIQVDDVAFSTSNWPFKDATASYSTNCSGSLSVDAFNSTSNSVSLYPNPSTSILNIEMSQNLKRATIYSVLGAEVLTTTSNTVTTKNLDNGLYLIKIESITGNVITKRFVKE